MENITKIFEQVYLPKQAIVIFEQQGGDNDYYVESYDMDAAGRPINAHPLTREEAVALAKSLDAEQERHKAFLKPEGLLPENVLYIDASHFGYVIWHTLPQHRELFFTDKLGIPNGKAKVPHLLWLASGSELYVFAVAATAKPTIDAELYHAPFFNLYDDGRVCMGTVDVDIATNSSLEHFIASWERYFFNSYFSHLINGHNPVKGNIVQLWQEQIGSKKNFPLKALIKTKTTIKKLMSWNF